MTTNPINISSNSSDNWSSHARKYNNAKNGESLSKPLLQSAFDNHFFPILDQFISSKKKEFLPIKILCLCGGTGAEMEIICKRYSKDQIQLINTDNAKGMVEVSQKLIEEEKYGDRAKSELMDAMEINVDNESFDLVTLILGPMLLPDPQKSFKEIARILKPNGLFFTLTPGPMELHDILYFYKKQILDEQNEGKDSGTRNVFEEQIVKNWGNPEALKRQIGTDKSLFKQIESKLNHSSFSTSTEGEVNELLESMWSNPGMSALYLNPLNEEQKEKYKNSIKQEFRKRQNQSPISNYSLSMNSCSLTAVKR